MTIMYQTKLIDDLIKENPDVTIKDFLETREEIRAVYKATEKMKYSELIEAIDKTLAA